MYTVGDIHGCYDTLVALLAKLPDDAKVCFVGDLIDRGPKSMQVVELVKNNPNYYCVKGNHEEMMVDDSDNALRFMSQWPSGRLYNHNSSVWCRNGGKETIQSYSELKGEGSEARNEFNFDKFKGHVEWMKTLPIYLEFDIKDSKDRPLVVSHSIIRHWHNRDDPKHIGYFNETALWGRNFANLRDQGIYNIIGHTPQGGATIKEMYANVDTGAVFNSMSSVRGLGLGTMTAIHFPSLETITQDNIEV